MSDNGEKTYGPAAVAHAAGVARAVFHSWVARRHLPFPPGPGAGKERRFTLLDAVRIAVVAEFNRLGLVVGLAARAADRVNQYELDKSLTNKKTGIIFVPSHTIFDSNTDNLLGGFGIFSYRTLADLDNYFDLRTDGFPDGFVFVSVTNIIVRTKAKLLESSASD